VLYTIFRPLAILLFKIFFRTKAYGMENIPRNGAFILASNHVSFLDPVVLGVASFRQLNFMAREDLFGNRFFRLLITSLNAFPVRKDGTGISGLKKALAKLSDGKVVAVFPEGTRGENGVIGRGEPGPGFLCAKAKAAVLPAFINGAGEALPRKAKFIRFRPISVSFGKLLAADGLLKIGRVSTVALEGGDLSNCTGRIDYQKISDAIMEQISLMSESPP
jgi:1-acyl-sn-glycerol-3-phosphate acyltransferase